MADMSVSGIASGIDWDSMITKLLERAQRPALVYVEKRDNLDLKKTSLEEFRVAMQAVQSALTPMKLASTFKAKQVEGERLDRNGGSFKSVLTAVANSDAAINVYDVEIQQLAKSQTNRSNQITGQVGSGLSYFYINAGGKKIRVDVGATDTNSTLATKINSQFQNNVPPIEMTASVVDNRLILKSNNTGMESKTLTASLHRSIAGNDLIQFPVNASNADAGTYTLDMEYGGLIDGELTIKSASGTTYVEGQDFDIVNGNQIRWHESRLPYARGGDSYKLTYTATGNETYQVSGTRAEDTDIDTEVLPYAAVAGSVTQITHNGTIYSEGTDFVVNGRNIEWKAGGSRPAAGSSYEIVGYKPIAGSTFELEALRDDTDAIRDSANTTQAYSALKDKTTRIQVNGRTYTQGVDYDIVSLDGTDTGEARVQWLPGSAYVAPNPGDSYALEVQQADGTWDAAAYNSTRTDFDEFDLTKVGFGGTIDGTVKLTSTTDFDVSYKDASNVTHYFSILSDATNTSTSTNGTLTLDGANNGVFRMTWPDAAGINAARANGYTPAARSVPQYLDEGNYTVTYKYNANAFSLSDDGNGTLAGLGLDQMDEDHYTAAQDAIILLDGEKTTRSSNRIGASFNNELIKGLTLELKSVGMVSLDISQDAEQAVTAVQNFTTAYNDVMSWIRTRLTESSIDKNKEATLDSDDFRRRWGILHGSSLLRDAQQSMRHHTSSLYVSSFTTRTSRESFYGSLSQKNIVNPGTITVTSQGRTLTLAIDPSDTLDTIAAKINDKTLGGEGYNPLFYDADGAAYGTPLINAKVEGGKLTLTGEKGVTLAGDNAILTAMGVNYEYTSLAQLGIKLPSSGAMSNQGLSGELEFSTSDFMAALEKNAEDASLVMTAFASRMQTYMDDMVKTSQKEVAPGVTSAQGAISREINAIDTEIAWIDDYLTEFQRRLDDKEKALHAQFSAAEVSLSKLMQQASWLATTTAQLQGAAAKAGA